MKKLKETLKNIVNQSNLAVFEDDYCVFIDNEGNRFVCSADKSFNMLFLKENGYTAKWGKTFEENPDYCPYGNEIADIEITTICRGIRNSDGVRKPCGFCYKANSSKGSYMSFDTFKKIFDLINQPKTMTQIAFGVDAECETNPDVWKIMDYCIANNVTPNVTVADITEETAENIVMRCGACAVSAYERDKNRCYDSIKLLTEKAKQLGKNNFEVNIHLLVSAETSNFVKEVINDRTTDNRLKDMNAIVLLSLKQKGRGVAFHKMDNDIRREVINNLLDKGISFGMDSCGANFFLDAIRGRDNYKRLEQMVENCEAFCFSLYINTDGKLFPCSFMDGEGEWKDGIDLASMQDFTKDVWEHKRVLEWRNKSIECIKCNGCNSCPHYDV